MDMIYMINKILYQNKIIINSYNIIALNNTNLLNTFYASNNSRKISFLCFGLVYLQSKINTIL